MTLAEAVASFEAEFAAVTTGEPQYCAPNGQPYSVIASGGPKPEGRPFPAKYASEEDAIVAWLAAARKFAAQYGDASDRVLCWRVRPELDRVPSRAKKRWVVYSRFAIMDKLPEAAAA